MARPFQPTGRAHALALLGSLLALGCGSGSDSGTGTRASAAPPAQEKSARSLAELVTAAEIRHEGVRRVEIFDEAGRQTLAYRERLVSDGEGRFSLRPIEPLTPVAGDWVPRQVNREGYLFRYRDFAVRSARLFRENYDLSGPEAAEPVAGRTVERYRAERRAGEPRSFDLWVDQATRLPLRVEERGPAGVLRSRVEYERLAEDPDLDAAIWFQKQHEERSLDPRADLGRQVGRPVPTPKLLPAGFRLHEAFTLVDDGGPWVKLVYTDGAETFFYLHRAADPAPESTSSPEVGAQLATSTPGGGDLFLHRLGAAGVAQATLEEGTFIAVGKVSDDELVDAIESALP